MDALEIFKIDQRDRPASCHTEKQAPPTDAMKGVYMKPSFEELKENLMK